ncbi:FliH/SctL family protein [Acidaminobacter sp.]|uniref:FliH/SctL family protein n=1 Tax=Acidaminobacter sp. TaxID=1872102 RepID=UPI00137C4CE0|nr:hypothetical protein [Acidaminobacter sp.]MDK9710585.1 hypothetical protein [Acidaminobacter sp.]MZQ96804.1 hypothetical protein [Acidaminobacter sp.]
MPSSYNVIKQPVLKHSDQISIKMPHKELRDSELLTDSFLEELELYEKAVLDQARAEAQSIRFQARQSGFEEGYNEGLNQAAASLEQKLTEISTQSVELLKSTHSLLTLLEKTHEEHLIQLAFQVASTFVQSHMSAENLKVPLRQMLKELSQSNRIVCNFHPEDYEIMDATIRNFQDLCPESKLVFVENNEIDKNAIHCETEAKIIAFHPGRQIEKLMAEILSLHKASQEAIPI